MNAHVVGRKALRQLAYVGLRFKKRFTIPPSHRLCDTSLYTREAVFFLAHLCTREASENLGFAIIGFIYFYSRLLCVRGAVA